MNRLKIYLSGPISGKPDANYPEFNDAAALVRAAGADPLLPHDIMPDHLGRCIPDGPIQPHSRHTYACHMRADIIAMLGCDAVVMLPLWEQSPGARVEHMTAAACGVPIFYLGEHGSMKTSACSHLFEAVREANGEDEAPTTPTWGPWGAEGRKEANA